MIVSWTGYPAPLLLYVCVAPLVRVTSTVNEDIDVVVDMAEENE
jgi:hypothetical protein